MDLEIDQINISDMVQDNHWDPNCFTNVFGYLFDNNTFNSAVIDTSDVNQWVWYPKSTCSKISAAVYHQLNQQRSSSDSWIGWHIIWHIPVAPRIKHFIWLCLKGFSSGSWAIQYRQSVRSLAFISAGAWFIWIARCNAIFKNIRPNLSIIASRTSAHVQDFFCSNLEPYGRKLILCNFSSADGPFIFTHAISRLEIQVRTIGFFISNANYKVILAGRWSQPLDDNSSDAILAIEAALQTTLQLQIPVKHIFSCHHSDLNFIRETNHSLAWRFRPQLSNLNFLMDMSSHPRIHVIPSSWMRPAISLAGFGLRRQNLNLYLVGRELPYWIMRSFLELGFSF
ncbi:uncharacterized protein LOC120274484 [Dioscorea cayenensis subsp. rotundata]|uniref:Uncharacterized protein LOC120274484 n=1 Tax=Dioscorea cayennensis subsp. rotundata TaxID=55577 RepID=A0AB40CAQ3_DIOCR|nr:uncharacterized protein LOC120274484 [Dioscorea cayenensis subsp. rotundata]